jgi:hypothetical protein
MRTLDNILSDRGSKYAVSGAPCTSVEEARALVAALKTNKKFARATHNSWGLRCAAGPVKNDDGESGAGMIILRMLEREGGRPPSSSPAGMAASIWAETVFAMSRMRFGPISTAGPEGTGRPECHTLGDLRQFRCTAKNRGARACLPWYEASESPVLPRACRPV